MDNEQHHQETSSQQIGESTVMRTPQGIAIMCGGSTCTFNASEAWELFAFLHNHADNLYHQLRKAGMQGFAATTSVIYEPCCEYILESMRRRGEILEHPPNEQGMTYETAVAQYRQMRRSIEQQVDQQEGWPLFPDEPITPGWTRLNESLLFCVSKIATLYGPSAQRMQRFHTWRVVVNYGVLAQKHEQKLAGFWKLEHPGVTAEETAQFQQHAAQLAGRRQDTVRYTPQELLSLIPNWSEQDDPAILEYDEHDNSQEKIDGHLIVAKLYLGGLLTPIALVERIDIAGT